MENANDQFFRTHGGQVRVRACGICVDGDSILLAGHKLPGREKLFWIPPGGGVQFGESVSAALRREFIEETGLTVEVGALLFMHEFINPPLHALELFFKIQSFAGSPGLGIDPEFSADAQIIKEIRFMSWAELSRLHSDEKHQLFRSVGSLEQILELRGVL